MVVDSTALVEQVISDGLTSAFRSAGQRCSALRVVQPFGGEGLSGTGPKAEGPHYLYRFATKRTLTINTAASGGNTELLSLRDDEDIES